MPKKTGKIKRGRKYASKKFAALRGSKRAQFAGRSTKNIISGALIYNVTTKFIGAHTARAGVYAMPLNMVISGAIGSSFGLSQKDMISSGAKIAASRLISTQLEPRLAGISGSSNRNGNSRSQGGY